MLRCSLVKEFSIYCLFVLSNFGRKHHHDAQAERKLTFYSDAGQSSILFGSKCF